LITDLYLDTACPACGKAHTLCHRDAGRHPPGAVYSYTCPASKVVVSFRPTAAPEPVILAPSLALPMTWVTD
jgi:hypothetical protein